MSHEGRADIAVVAAGVVRAQQGDRTREIIDVVAAVAAMHEPT